MSYPSIRSEKESDCARISEVISLAFQDDPNGREAEIVELMRADSALTISLVAELNNEIVGHIAFSKVTINEQFIDWYGLAPVSIEPKYQNQGIGSELIREGLKLLQGKGVEEQGINAKGCVLLGDPTYYQRFGFEAHAQLIYPGVPSEYFQALSFGGAIPAGTIKYHEAFGE